MATMEPEEVFGKEGLIKLNVGGVHYSTSTSTLSKYSDSMLGRLVNGDLPTTKDEDGAIFIDR